MGIQLIGNGPELFRIKYRNIEKRPMKSFPDIMEREFPENKGCLLTLTIGSPYFYSYSLKVESRRRAKKRSSFFCAKAQEILNLKGKITMTQKLQETAGILIPGESSENLEDPVRLINPISPERIKARRSALRKKIIAANIKPRKEFSFILRNSR